MPLFAWPAAAGAGTGSGLSSLSAGGAGEAADGENGFWLLFLSNFVAAETLPRSACGMATWATMSSADLLTGRTYEQGGQIMSHIISPAGRPCSIYTNTNNYNAKR